MITLLISLLLVFVPDSPGKNAPKLTHVIYSQKDKRVDYVFDSPKWDYTYQFSYQDGGKAPTMRLLRSGKPIMIIKMIGKNKFFYKKDGRWTALKPGQKFFSKTEIYLIRYFVDAIIGFPPEEDRIKGWSFPTGLAPYDFAIGLGSASTQSGDNSCTQTGSCSCPNGSVTVTCPCGLVITCEERSSEVCDYQDDGTPTNCRTVTGCSGFCA